MADPNVARLAQALCGDLPYDAKEYEEAADLLVAQAVRIQELEAALKIEHTKTLHWKRPAIIPELSRRVGELEEALRGLLDDPALECSHVRRNAARRALASAEQRG